MIVFIENAELPSLNEYKYLDFPAFKNELLIWNHGGVFKIFSSFCPHFGGILAIKNDKLHCYFHDYEFDPETGSCMNREFGGKCQKIDYFEESEGLSVEII